VNIPLDATAIRTGATVVQAKGRTMPKAETTNSDSTSEIAIFARLIKADKGDLARSLARYILTLGFSPEDESRMRDLAERN
jgi:hypothetical protein